MTTVPRLDGWPAIPAPVSGCTECDQLVSDERSARSRGDGAAETDARVLLRHHLTDRHHA